MVHHAVDREEDFDLRPVRAVRDLFMLFPKRMEEERERPLRRWESGTAVTRGELRGLLGEAGVAHGCPCEVTGTHSLRCGGASALYHFSGGNQPLVKRLGRWQCEAVEGYVWEDRLLTRGLSGGMLTAPWAVSPGSFAPLEAQ